MRQANLGNTCVVGLQWGDEGKGKVVDALVERFDVVVRYSGGPNAGHTVVVAGDRFALHQLPSGVLRPRACNMITGGAVIDPAVLLGELESLRQRGVSLGASHLRISDRAHLLFPYHRQQDLLAERAALPGAKIGTTARGVGPCYADKVSRRWGVRVCELYDVDRFRARLSEIIAHKNAYLAALYDVREPLDARSITDEYLAFAEQLRPHVCDTTIELGDAISRGASVLFEGAQGALLDIDHGTYPYVTSASSGVGGVASGAGVSPRVLRSVVGVMKAYTTRVGEGPLPTELTDATGDRIRETGREFGTTTGRPRRCGWFDAVAAGYSARLTGPTHLALMHLDTLSGFDEIRVCTGYRLSGGLVSTFPANTNLLEQAEPVYESLPGWSQPIDGCREYDELPDAARRYVERLGALLGAPVCMISVGPDREQTIYRD